MILIYRERGIIMKKITKIISLITAAVLIMCCTPFAFADNADSSRLYGVYGDGMLFKQNEEAVFSGTAPEGAVISAELFSSDGRKVTGGDTVASSDGKFSVSFIAPGGSYEEYTVILKADGKEFSQLKNVVFGELWLASGQSNMQYGLAQAKSAAESFAKGEKLNKWVRALLVPAYPEYNGSTSLVPYEPQSDIINAKWVNGESMEIYSMSAVGYFFADALQKKLDMPVGILNSSLGGSSIRSWLSRESIESDSTVYNYLREIGAYVEKSAWNEAQQSVYYDMTANFNQKTAPLTDFRLSGMIWYQGETDLIFGNTCYAEQFSLLQESYTEYFSFENGLLPVIYTQIAAYNYSDDGFCLNDWNIMYCEMQNEKPSSRAVVTISDVPLTYLPEAGLIHPESKKEVADKMAFAAMGLVYGEHDSYTAPVVRGYEIKDGSIYADFSHTGDGLVCSANTVKGFAVAGKDGVFVKADAEITDNDTVKIRAASVSEPVYFSYAYCVDNGEANLFASLDGEKTLPVSAFVSEKPEEAHYWKMPSWTYCDSDKVWYTEDDANSGYTSTWTGNNAELSFSADSALVENAMKINAEDKKFSVSPVISYGEGLQRKLYSSAEGDFSDYSQLTVYIKNDGAEDVNFTGAKLYVNPVLWYFPAVKGSLDVETVIPADGEYHEICLELGRIYHLGNECSLSYDNEKLSEIMSIELCFASSEKNAKLSVDEITFTPSKEDAGTRYEVDIRNADTVTEFFTGLFLTVFGKFAALFV